MNRKQLEEKAAARAGRIAAQFTIAGTERRAVTAAINQAILEVADEVRQTCEGCKSKQQLIECNEVTFQAMEEKIEKQQEEIDNLSAGTIHSCSEACQRVECVQRREIERLKTQIDGPGMVGLASGQRGGDR